jgi:hypothetical protein
MTAPEVGRMPRIRVPISIPLGLALAISGFGAGIVAGSIPASDGTIHGCYATRNGALRVIDAPAQSCGRGEVPIEWKQQGEKGDPGDPGPAIASLDGVPCDTVSGTGSIHVSTATTVSSLGASRLGYAMSLACVPAGDYLRIIIYGPGTVQADPAPANGPSDCVGVYSASGTPVVCVLFYPAGTLVHMTATPDDGNTVYPQTWYGIDGCTVGASTCDVTLADPGVDAVVGFQPAT